MIMYATVYLLLYVVSTCG